MKHTIEVIGDALIITFGAWSVFTFAHILLYGRLFLVEPNMAILATETILAVGVVAVGIERLIDDLKK